MRIIFYVWGALFFVALLKWWLIDTVAHMEPTINYVMYLLVWIGGLLFFGIAALLAKTEQASQSSSTWAEPKPDPSVTRIFDDKPTQKIAIGILAIVGGVLAWLFFRAYFVGAAP